MRPASPVPYPVDSDDYEGLVPVRGSTRLE